MDTPFSAYQGDEPYIFVCYAHEDDEIVYPEIRWLRDQGINIWYDEGISAGKVWRRELAVAIQNWHQTRKGPGYSEESVQKKIHQWTARDHLRKYLEFDLRVEGSQVVALDWCWNRKLKRKIQRRYLGKTILFTDQHEWESSALALAYRKLWKSEALFRLSKARQGPWWPLYHWTDSKIRVHALYCYFALLLLSILQLKLQDLKIMSFGSPIF